MNGALLLWFCPLIFGPVRHTRPAVMWHRLCNFWSINFELLSFSNSGNIAYFFFTTYCLRKAFTEKKPHLCPMKLNFGNQVTGFAARLKMFVFFSLIKWSYCEEIFMFQKEMKGKNNENCKWQWNRWDTGRHLRSVQIQWLKIPKLSWTLSGITRSLLEWKEAKLQLFVY